MDSETMAMIDNLATTLHETLLSIQQGDDDDARNDALSMLDCLLLSMRDEIEKCIVNPDYVPERQ